MKSRPTDRDYYRRVSDLIEELRPTLPVHPHPGAARTEKVWWIARIALLAILVLAALTYAADYAVARVRLTRGSALGSVEVARMVAIPQKSGKTEFEYSGAESVTCVRSLFPHFGYTPCWYASRNSGIKF